MIESWRKNVNSGMMGIFILSAVLSLAPLFAVLGYVLFNGIGALNWDFFVQLPGGIGVQGGGMANAIVGTLILIFIACLMGIPVGFLAAIYLVEYDRTSWFSTIVRFTTDVLTGVPSIIIGIVVYTAIVVPMKHFSAWAAGIALGIIMIPVVVRSTEEMLKLVPHSVREAGLALGVPKWRIVLWIVVPASARGIITGIMLAVARVSGETAPLLFTALGNRYWAHSLNEPIASLPVQIYDYAVSPYTDWHRQAWAGALVLLMIVMILNLGTRFVFKGRQK
ncbi:MAG: phosphate ABC transporter permease PstA [Desulfosporosinus sp.]|nr:phosphate ABC transporter permease PstA [Desulfosporosinus sp.]